MKFNIWTSRKQTHVKAIFEEDDTKTAKRAEGAGTKILLQNDTASFEYKYTNIHPDLAAQLCMIIFHPFIGSSVEFPWPVSPSVQKAFDNKDLKVTKIKIRNIDNSLTPYKGTGQYAIAFGGGLDSSCIRAMFPDAILVHETSYSEKKIFGLKIKAKHKDKTTEIVSTHINGIDIKTNQRYMSTPGGWHTWTASLATSVLIATDYNISAILMGSNMGSSFLQNGSGYFDRFLPYRQQNNGCSGIAWQNTFYCVGLPAFSPVAGLTEVANAKIAYSRLDPNEIISCTNDAGAPCNRCFKCLRRSIIRAGLGLINDVKWDSFDNSTNRTAIKQEPLYFGHVYSYCAPRIKNLPAWIQEPISNVISAEWALHYYPDLLRLIPPTHRDNIKMAIEKYLSPMDEEMVSQVKNWPNKVSAITK